MYPVYPKPYRETDMYKKTLAFLLLSCFVSSMCLAESWDFTFETVSATTNSDGTELVTTVSFQYADGNQFFADFIVTESEISSPGGGLIPPTSNFPVSGVPDSGGSWGPGPAPGVGDGSGGSGHIIIHGDNSRLGPGLAECEDHKQMGGGLVVPIIGAATCAINHFAQLRTLERACGDAGVDRLRTGVCGFGGSVRCNEPPPPPPPEPDALFWTHLSPMWWVVPTDWGWPEQESFLIMSGL